MYTLVSHRTYIFQLFFFLFFFFLFLLLLQKHKYICCRRTSPRWEGGNRLDRDHGSTEYVPDFTATKLTEPGLASSRRTTPRWDGGTTTILFFYFFSEILERHF